MDCSLPSSSDHGIFQARIPEWVAIFFSRKSSQPRDWTWVSHSVGRCFTVWDTSSVQFSHSVLSDSLRPHELQHTRPLCPLPIPRVHPNPCPLSQWCHPTISSSVIHFSCPQSFPASGSFQISSSHQVAKVFRISKIRSKTAPDCYIQ